MSKLRLAILLIAFVVLEAGVYQFSTNPAHASDCPSGGGCGGGTAYAPVICKGHCRYINMCHATCAGFSSTQCKDANPQ
jgi:hypothetical protein